MPINGQNQAVIMLTREQLKEIWSSMGTDSDSIKIEETNLGGTVACTVHPSRRISLVSSGGEVHVLGGASEDEE